MSFPAPRPGLVIRYSFLWSREAKSGAIEGRRDRPCAIVVAAPLNAQGETRVAVVPITPSAPLDPETAIALPAAVQRMLGLDVEPAWICLDEINVFAWPGFDVRTIPGTDRIAYGPLPQHLFEQVRQGVLRLNRERRAQQTERVG